MNKTQPLNISDGTALLQLNFANLCFILSALLSGFAVHSYTQGIGMYLIWPAFALLLAGAKHSKHPYCWSLISCFLFHVVLLHWVPNSIMLYSQLGRIAAISLAVVFYLYSCLQFLFFIWIYRRIRQSRLEDYCLAFPLAWITAEFITPKVLPWSIAQTQLEWIAFSSLAEFVGVYPLGALMIWIVALFVDALGAKPSKSRRRLAHQGIPLAIITVLLCLGFFRNHQLTRTIQKAPTIKVALVQGNVEAHQKRDRAFYTINLTRYQQLTKEAEQAGVDLVIWPETVILHSIPTDLELLNGKHYDPHPEAIAPLLFGAISAGNDGKRALRYNSMLLRSPAGFVSGRYFKRKLMPYGEFIPFVKQFPWLQQLSPTTSTYSRGKSDLPLKVEVAPLTGTQTLRSFSAALLICFEDLIPQLSRRTVNNGANIIISASNDAWFGQTVAASLHNRMAAWRAIENRRFLLRPTNTGLTTVINPCGQTVSSIQQFNPSVLHAEIPLLDSKTLFTKYGNWLTWPLCIWCLLLVVLADPKLELASTSGLARNS